MALSHDLRLLRARALSELAAAHDYYADTTSTWRIVQTAIAGGNAVSNRNLITGTVTTEIELAAKARGYLSIELPQAMFQQFVSIFESFRSSFFAFG